MAADGDSESAWSVFVDGVPQVRIERHVATLAGNGQVGQDFPGRVRDLSGLSGLFLLVEPRNLFRGQEVKFAAAQFIKPFRRVDLIPLAGDDAYGLLNPHAAADEIPNAVRVFADNMALTIPAQGAGNIFALRVQPLADRVGRPLGLVVILVLVDHSCGLSGVVVAHDDAVSVLGLGDLHGRAFQAAQDRHDVANRILVALGPHCLVPDFGNAAGPGIACILERLPACVGAGGLLQCAREGSINPAQLERGLFDELGARAPVLLVLRRQLLGTAHGAGGVRLPGHAQGRLDPLALLLGEYPTAMLAIPQAAQALELILDRLRVTRDDKRLFGNVREGVGAGLALRRGRNCFCAWQARRRLRCQGFLDSWASRGSGLFFSPDVANGLLGLLRPRPFLELGKGHFGDRAQALPPLFVIGEVGFPRLVRVLEPDHGLVLVELARFRIHLIDHEHGRRALGVGSQEHVHMVLVRALRAPDVPIMVLHLRGPFVALGVLARPDGARRVFDGNVQAIHKDVALLVVARLLLFLGRRLEVVQGGSRGLVRLLVHDGRRGGSAGNVRATPGLPFRFKPGLLVHGVLLGLAGLPFRFEVFHRVGFHRAGVRGEALLKFLHLFRAKHGLRIIPFRARRGPAQARLFRDDLLCRGRGHGVLCEALGL